MDAVTLASLLIVILFLVLGTGTWIALALGIVAYAGMVIAVSAPPGQVLATSVWGAATSWDLTALPMFIWMGEILYRTRLSQDMFSGLAPWMRALPGRLLHVNVVGCTIFAAVSGSSAATCATIGRISLPELKKRGYDERLAIGTLAGGGTLGLLIPPSLIMIVYGAATEQSIARLFIAGIVPGIIVAGLFMAYVGGWALLNPGRMPEREPSMPLRERLAAGWRLIPVILLILGVIGSIYGGFASATEAAVVGVALSLVMSRAMGTLDWASFRDGLLGATRTSCMIAFILAGAAFLTTAMGFTGIPRALAEWIGAMNLSPWQLLLALTLFYMVLGCFLDGISMVVLTTAVIMPLVQAAGFDLIWFGIYIVIVVEMAQITPPVGFNLYVLQGMTGRSIFRIGLYALPFFLILAIVVALLAIFPDLALWLPRTMLEAG
ncbi:TRAP transporter large permease subunit [Chelatococcus daeguensis]|uniref:TRAP transporter large permease n=1 Tax=Chelatococcus daeguensis TaxID=444444 RepID=UPI0007AB4A9F|nr:TRAP transporter large permease subunit [Chelatococcus daeguensis]KZE27427.1 C4-dicarboxylate ABC transporter permease [Chelatococcus daeguensis]MBM3085639.1 TRAP transporter large permease subunit [Chelatococcus daeguensis]